MWGVFPNIAKCATTHALLQSHLRLSWPLGLSNEDYRHEAAHTSCQANCAAHVALCEVAAARQPACPPHAMIGQSVRRRAHAALSEGALSGSCSWSGALQLVILIRIRI
eukprot:5460581-Prymnesium_polylepis.1